MLSAVSSLSAFGNSYTIARIAATRVAQSGVCPVCGGVHPDGTAHVGPLQSSEAVGTNTAYADPNQDGEVNVTAYGDTAQFSLQALQATRAGVETGKADSSAVAQTMTGETLSDAEKEQVEKLKARDAEVRAHEAAHKAAAGQYAGAVSYTYQTGPDGKRYAVGGEVDVDTSPIPGDPEATIAKMQQISAAASAPAEPSSADRQVAAQATQAMNEARAELSQKTMNSTEEETREGGLMSTLFSSPTASGNATAATQASFQSRLDIYA